MLDALKPSSMEILLTLSKFNSGGEIYLCACPLRSFALVSFLASDSKWSIPRLHIWTRSDQVQLLIS